MLAEIEPGLTHMGELAGGELYRLQLADRENEPTLTQWDAWGNRVDRIEVTPLWKRAERLAAEQGLVAAAYERRHGAFSRVHQFALAYLFTPSTDLYSCPLAMTDGAARALARFRATSALIERAVPRLTSRDPKRFWTSGQWMTESDRRLRRRADRDRRAAGERRLAALRAQVVHVGDRLADGAHAGAARGQSRRAARGSRSSTWRRATRRGARTASWSTG